MLSMLVKLDKAKLAAAEGAVIKAAHYAELVEAREVVAAAGRYAQKLRAGVDAEVAAARKSGYEEGMKAAHEEFAASITETVASMESAFAGLEARIVNTVVNAVQQIVRGIDERELMEGLIRRVLHEARSQKQLRLRVAAAQYDGVNEQLTAILRDFPDVEFIDVLKDPGAAYATCVLESEFGAVDASLDTQLAAVRRGLINAFIGKRVAAAAASD